MENDNLSAPELLKLIEEALETLHAGVTRISTAIGVAQAIQIGLQTAIEVSGADSGGIYLLSDDRQRLELQHHTGLGKTFVEKKRCFPVDSRQYRIVCAGKPLYFNRGNLPTGTAPALEQEGIVSLAILPLHHGDELIGCLNVSSHAIAEIPASAQSALETIAAVSAQTIARERVAEKLRRSEREYKSFFENSPAGIFRTTSTGKVLHINQAMANIIGYAHIEELLEKIKDIAQDLYVKSQRREEFIKELQKTGNVKNFEYEARRADGKTAWLSVSARISSKNEDGAFFIDGFCIDITGRKIAETELQLEKSRAQQYLDVAQIMLLALDTEQRVTLINPKGCEILGLPAEDIIGKNWFDHFLVSEEKEVVKSLYNKLLHAEIPSLDYHENKVRRKDGEERLIGWRNSYLRDSSGKVSGFLSSGEDITERRRGEDSLRQSEEKYRTLFETMIQGVVYQDASGNITSVNPAACEILGLSEDQLMGRTSLDPRWRTIHEDGTPFAGDEHPAMVSLREGRPVLNEVMGVFNPRENDYRWIFVSAIPMFRAAETSPREVYATITDVTPLKKADLALLKSELKFRRIFESIDDVYYQTDREEKLTLLSPSVYRLGGYTPEELIGKHVSYLYFNPEERELMVTQLAARGRVYDYEVLLKKKDGTPIPCSLSARIINDEQGEFIGIAGMVRDISERKAAEAEREKLLSQLNQAQKLESIGRLAGGVAHDFNNMLQGILGYSALALDRVEEGSRLHGYLLEINKAAERSANLTKQLLAFARRQTIVPVILDLNDTVSGMLRMLRRLIGEDVRLIWKPGYPLWRVKIDPTQVDQILANLSVNARDAIDENGIITIATRNVVIDEELSSLNDNLAPGNYVLLSFSDNGAGISPDSLQMIFEPFFTTKEVGQGTGLGLATVYGILKQNNGHVAILSEVGKGTTLSMYFQAFVDENTEPEPEEDPAADPTGNETILFVEDDEMILKTGQELMRNLGYRVLIANTPSSALEIAANLSEEIDLLITDVIMPGMNGRELAGRISRIKPKTKCLYISGYPVDFIAQKGMLAAGIDLIEKPFSIRKLGEKVRTILDRDKKL